MPLILSIAAFRVPCFAGFYSGETTGLDPVKASLTVLETCATPSKWAKDPLQRSAAKTEIPSDFKQEDFSIEDCFLFMIIHTNFIKFRKKEIWSLQRKKPYTVVQSPQFPVFLGQCRVSGSTKARCFR